MGDNFQRTVQISRFPFLEVYLIARAHFGEPNIVPINRNSRLKSLLVIERQLQVVFYIEMGLANEAQDCKVSFRLAA